MVTDKVTNYSLTIPLYRGTSHEIQGAVGNYVFFKHGPQSI